MGPRYQSCDRSKEDEIARLLPWTYATPFLPLLLLTHPLVECGIIRYPSWHLNEVASPEAPDTSPVRLINPVKRRFARTGS